LCFISVPEKSGREACSWMDTVLYIGTIPPFFSFSYKFPLENLRSFRCFFASGRDGKGFVPELILFKKGG
jgi:hypothetical protein